VITVDNGLEFYSRRTDAWAYQHGIQLIFSRPGKPMDNPFIESFNGRLRDEHLNVELFFSVGNAQHKLLEWQRDYNEARPHSSLGNIPPREFVAQWQFHIRFAVREQTISPPACWWLAGRRAAAVGLIDDNPRLPAAIREKAAVRVVRAARTSPCDAF